MTNGTEQEIAVWAEEAFRAFNTPKRAELLATVETCMRRILASFEAAQADAGERRALAQLILDVSGWIDDGHVWHRDTKLRSYVDVSVRARILRIFVDHLATRGGNAPELLELMLEASPDSRPVLLVQAELFIERGALDEAIALLRTVLRIQAVCPTAQQLLFRAYQAKRDLGCTDHELAVLDYDLSDKFCPMPFTHLSTGYRGAAFACSCPAWIPFPIGNVLDAESADAVWNSEVAAEIRRSVLDGDFTYCSRTLCSVITARKLPTRSEVTDPVLRGYIDGHTTVLPAGPNMADLNYDPTCNLACPSCRKELILASTEEQDLYAKARDRVILPLLKRVHGQSYISGGGEAFASKHFRSILGALSREEYPGLFVYLITNALLITPHRWSEFPNLPEMISVLSVSIDAARAETYEKLRRPGKWSTLMTNLEFIAELRRSGKIRSLSINFVVQKDNYREMLEFVELGDRLGADKIWFQSVVNYGSYDGAAFADIDVTSPQHPEHGALLEILRHPAMKGPKLQMLMLMSLAPEVYADEKWDAPY